MRLLGREGGGGRRGRGGGSRVNSGVLINHSPCEEGRGNNYGHGAVLGRGGGERTQAVHFLSLSHTTGQTPSSHP